MAGPFATVEELQAAMQRDVPRATALLNLQRASGAIRSETHWSVSREVVVDEVVNTGRGGYRLWLPTLHLVSVQSVVEGGLTLTDGSHFTWDASGTIYRNGWWPRNVGSVVVSYTHGWDPDHHYVITCKDICLAVAARLTGNPLRHSSETTGSESWVAGVAQAEATLSDGEIKQLAPFTLERLG